MTSPWIVARPTDSSERLRLASAHDSVIATRTAVSGVRRLVQESWQRSLQLELDPDHLGAAIDFDEDDLHEYRSAHPMALALPTIHSLLIRHTFDAGLIVAIGDDRG